MIHKLLLFTLPLVVLSIASTTVILSWLNYRHFGDAIGKDYRNLAESAASEIQTHMEGARRSLESLALVLSAGKPDEWQREMILTAYSQKCSNVISVSVLSPDGAVPASEDRMPEEHAARNKERTFQEALSGSSALSAIMLTKEGVPYIVMAAPIKRLGKVSAVLWSELSLKAVWNVVKRINVGKAGAVYIMDETGHLVADRNVIYTLKASYGTEPAILERIKSGIGPTAWVEDVENVKHHRLGSLIPDMKWIVVISRPATEVYTYLFKTFCLAGLIASSICLFAALIAWFSMKRFLRPIHDLHHQVSEVSEGKLDRKVSVSSHDEIGDLGIAFNRMIDCIKGYVEREVETAKELVHTRNLSVLGTASSKVTHEVGNLLSNIAFAIPALKREVQSPNGRRSIELLELESERIRYFIESFLQFARRPELQLHKIAMKVMIDEVLSVHESRMREMGIRAEVSCAPDLPPICADARLMYVVLNNLIKNSLEAMDGSGGTLAIEARTEGEHLRVDLKDSGPGIEPSVLENLFQPFFTTKGRKGTGLGLSICKTIVEAHCGTIGCACEPGEGAAFRIHLPLRQPLTPCSP